MGRRLRQEKVDCISGYKQIVDIFAHIAYCKLAPSEVSYGCKQESGTDRRTENKTEENIMKKNIMKHLTRTLALALALILTVGAGNIVTAGEALVR